MAKIIDPDQLNDGTECTIQYATRKIKLTKTGNLSTDGVTLQCLYSFLKEEWKTNATLVKYPFPMVSITNEQFELVNGWDFTDQATKDSIRDGGWALKDNAGVSQEEYMNVTTLGLFENSTVDKAYYLQSSGGTPTDVVLTGPVNQAVKIYGDATHGTVNYRTFFKIYLRTAGKTYAFGDLISDQNISALTYKKYALPISNAIDLKVSTSDTLIDTTLPFTGMSITWGAVTKMIGGTNRTFAVEIDGNFGTAEQIYEYVQRQLRKTTDIDAAAGTSRGDITQSMLGFIGDTLKTKLITSGGVYIKNFKPTDTNRIVFVDNGGVERQYPFVAAGSLKLNDNLVNDVASYYRMFFTNDDAGDNTGRDFGSSTAMLVNDNSGTPISGDVTGRSEIGFDYDYDGNIQRGAVSAGTTVPVTIVASGLSTAQPVLTTGTITRSTSNIFSLVSSLERNYSNN